MSGKTLEYQQVRLHRNAEEGSGARDGGTTGHTGNQTAAAAAAGWGE